jgi:large subunit ribosomal protein L3
MGAPRRGSMGFYPRVRAKSIRVTVKSWPKISLTTPKLLGFVGYKAFMCSVLLLDSYEKSPTYGKEVVKACTVIEVPPLFIAGIKLYGNRYGRLVNLTTIFTEKIPEKISKYYKFKNKKPINVDSLKNHIAEVRVIACTQPYLTTIGKKKPEIFEIKVGGEPVKALEYAQSVLGKEVKIDEVFNEGEYIDIIGITKGKGFQGVVKRFGVKILPRWHKHRKGYRKVGSIGPIEPTLMRFVPRAGQMGFHKRTIYNKKIILLGKDPSIINKKGGIPHYGIIKNSFILLLGSVMGPPKRVIFLRAPIKPPKHARSYKLIQIIK